MNFSSGFRNSYPKLTAWIYEAMLNVPAKPTVWKAFKKYSELSEMQARAALLTCSAKPIIDVKDMKDYGIFDGAKDKDRVYLGKFMCDKFEGSRADAKDPRMHILIEATVLHELVHWGDWKDGMDQADEEGESFEKAAYGKIIARYW